MGGEACIRHTRPPGRGPRCTQAVTGREHVFAWGRSSGGAGGRVFGDDLETRREQLLDGVASGGGPLGMRRTTPAMDFPHPLSPQADSS